MTEVLSLRYFVFVTSCMISSTYVARSPQSPKTYFGSCKVSKKREGIQEEMAYILQWVGKIITWGCVIPMANGLCSP